MSISIAGGTLPAVALARSLKYAFGSRSCLIQTQSSFSAAGRAPPTSTRSVVDVDLRNGTLAAKKRLTQLIHKVVFCLENAVQYCVRRGGPLYIFVASALIGSVVLVYFGFVFPQVLASNTKLVASCHLTGGLFCLLNIIFNYVGCITTDPGSAQVLDKPGYQMVALQCQRHCKRCNKPKPPLAHHCHICGRCVLRMDHHCPWMHSCVGFHNYRFFVLFTLYLWLGSAYSAGMLFSELARAGQLSRRRRGEAVYPYVLLCPFVLSAAVSCALTALVGWHAYLIWHAQSTIDMLNFWRDSKLAKEKGDVLVHPYDLGPLRNFQEVFDVSGKRFWWIRWMLPSRAKRRGDGIFFPTMYDSLHAQPQELSSATWALQNSMEVLSSSGQHMV